MHCGVNFDHIFENLPAGNAFLKTMDLGIDNATEADPHGSDSKFYKAID